MIEYETARKKIGKHAVAELAKGMDMPGETLEAKVHLIGDCVAGGVAWWEYEGADSEEALAFFLEREFHETGRDRLLELLGGPRAVASKLWPRLQEESKMDDELYFDINEAKTAKLIKRGKCLGRDYAIVSRGIHPCAYVALLSNDLHNWGGGTNECADVVNGGLTYVSTGLLHDKIPPQSRLASQALDAPYGIIGWDYGHFDDYCEPAGGNSFPEIAEIYREFNKGRKKWTLPEIEKEVLAMCKWLEKRKHHEPK